MPEIVVAPLADYADQVTNFGPFAVADAVQAVDIKVRRCTSLDLTIWPNASTRLQVQLFVSLDGGATWIPQGGLDSTGGIAFKKDGIAEQDFAIAGGGLPVGTARQGKGTLTITGGPLRTAMSVLVT